MPREAWRWKDYLLAEVRDSRTRTQQVNWTAKTSRNFEQELVFGFYTIRRLGEHRKLPPEVAAQRVPVVVCPARQVPDERTSMTVLRELFGLNRAGEASVLLAELCRDILQSCALEIYLGEPRKLLGFASTTDLSETGQLYTLDADRVCELFECVGRAPYPRTRLRDTRRASALGDA